MNGRAENRRPLNRALTQALRAPFTGRLTLAGRFIVRVHDATETEACSRVSQFRRAPAAGLCIDS